MADDTASNRFSGRAFTTFLRPWLAENPTSFDRPGIDYSALQHSLLAEMGAHAAFCPGP
jgi:hypothetical protein